MRLAGLAVFGLAFSTLLTTGRNTSAEHSLKVTACAAVRQLAERSTDEGKTWSRCGISSSVPTERNRHYSINHLASPLA